MNTGKRLTPLIFGEVLFDCFPNGETVLGGAPFNVAWHLQAMGDAPSFVSRVGRDELGEQIVSAMQAWQMSILALQFDEQHPTGQVAITIEDDEPHYDITPDSAYDFIDASALPSVSQDAILYHGSLALRNPHSRAAFESLAAQPNLSIFLDVNLRSPWWNKEEILAWLSQARWAKLNDDELALLVDCDGQGDGDMEADLWRLRELAGLEMLVVTCGEDGAIAGTADGELFRVRPGTLERFVDTVGAGDAFTAMLLHGLLNDWPLAETMEKAQQFASRVVGQRGATPSERDFYQGL